MRHLIVTTRHPPLPPENEEEAYLFFAENGPQIFGDEELKEINENERESDEHEMSENEMETDEHEMGENEQQNVWSVKVFLQSNYLIFKKFLEIFSSFLSDLTRDLILS